MANRYGKTGAQIIEERKKRMLQMQKKGIMRTGASILQSRGKIYPDYHSQDIYESPIDTLYKQTDVAKEEPVLPKPQLPKEFIEAQKITPSIISDIEEQPIYAPSTEIIQKPELPADFSVRTIDAVRNALRESQVKTISPSIILSNIPKETIPKIQEPTIQKMPERLEPVKSDNIFSRIIENLKYIGASIKRGIADTPINIENYLTKVSQEIIENTAERVKKTAETNKIDKFISDITRPIASKIRETAIKLPGIDYTGKTLEQVIEEDNKNRREFYNQVRDKIYEGIDMSKVSGVGAFMGGVLGSMPQMTLNFIPGVGPALFAISAGGGYAREAEEKGATRRQQIAYGAVGGATEVTLQKLFEVIPGIKKLYSTPLGEAHAKQVLKNAISETLEEALTEPITGFAEKFIYNPDKPWVGEEGIISWDIGLEGLAGTVMSLMFSAFSLPSSYRAYKRALTIVDKGTEITPQEFNNLVKDYVADVEKVKKEQPELLMLPAPYQKPVRQTVTPDIIEVPGIQGIQQTAPIQERSQQVQQPEMVQQPKTIQQPLKQSKDKIPEYVQRIEEPNVKRATVEKPQGIYTSPSDIESPHKYLGGDVFYWKTNPDANILRIETGYFKTNRGFVGESAGIGAARKLFGDNEVVRMTKLSKQKLAKELSQKYPNVDWEKYYDQQEMIEGYAGLALRERGYDAIWAVDKEAPEFTEFVALTENAMTPVDKIETEEKPSIKQTVEQYTKDMTDKERKALNRYVINLTNQVVKNYEQNGNILTPEQVNELINKHLEIGKSVIEHIKNKNFDELTARLHRGNINSLNLFTDITGLSTKTQKETEKSIRALDPDAYDKWLEAKNLEIKKRREQEELEIMERELQQKTRYKNKIMTTKEFIDQIISEGFTNLSSEKKGVIPILRLSKGNESFAFSNKYERMYIEKAIKELESKKSELSKLDL